MYFYNVAYDDTGGTKVRHIRPHNGLQGFTCIEVAGRVNAEMAR